MACHLVAPPPVPAEPSFAPPYLIPIIHPPSCKKQGLGGKVRGRQCHFPGSPCSRSSYFLTVTGPSLSIHLAHEQTTPRRSSPQSGQRAVRAAPRAGTRVHDQARVWLASIHGHNHIVINVIISSRSRSVFRLRFVVVGQTGGAGERSGDAKAVGGTYRAVPSPFSERKKSICP